MGWYLFDIVDIEYSKYHPVWYNNRHIHSIYAIICLLFDICWPCGWSQVRDDERGAQSYPDSGLLILLQQEYNRQELFGNDGR